MRGRPAASTGYASAARTINAEGDIDVAGTLGTTNYPADMPVSLATPLDGDNDDDTLRTETRDSYWAQVEAGKAALIELWNGAEQSKTDVEESGKSTNSTAREVATDIRIVAARPGGHDKYEGIHEFLCQSGCFTAVTRTLAADSSIGATAVQTDDSGDEVGSWADPDVFDLAKERPTLSYRPREGRRGEGAGDWRGQGNWWTGELPRIRPQRQGLNA